MYLEYKIDLHMDYDHKDDDNHVFRIAFDKRDQRQREDKRSLEEGKEISIISHD